MERLTLPQHLKIVQIYYEKRRSVKIVQRGLRPTYGVDFWLDGYVNKQTCRNCAEEHPEIIQEQLLHPLKTIHNKMALLSIPTVKQWIYNCICISRVGLATKIV